MLNLRKVNSFKLNSVKLKLYHHSAVQQAYAAPCTVLFGSLAGNISIPSKLERRQNIKYLGVKSCMLYYESISLI